MLLRRSAVLLVFFMGSSVAFSDGGTATKQKAANRFMGQVVTRERKFYQPGVSYDKQSGLTFDGRALHYDSGKLRGPARNWSAASKESLHLILLAKAIAGESTAQRLLSPRAKVATARAIDVLTRKIASYENFDAAYPGYGGFLPWFKIADGKAAPASNWQERVPGLDNGQLAWSLYVTANALRDAGEITLADRYDAHLAKMKKNVVAIFYDPTAKKMRTEASLAAGNKIAPAKNRYENNQPNHFLDDAYEGTLLCHFADLMGDWSTQPRGKEAIWRTPRVEPARFNTRKGNITIAKGDWFSSHEEWKFLVLPFRDSKTASRIFVNAQRARTQAATENVEAGLYASTHAPVAANAEPSYESALGVMGANRHPLSDKKIFAAYAAFPLALVDKPLFAGWLKAMIRQPGMFGPYGIGESFSPDGTHAPIATWDGKALPLVAWMGGIATETKLLLKRDGLYDAFLERVQNDYSRFKKIEGEKIPLAAP